MTLHPEGIQVFLIVAIEDKDCNVVNIKGIIVDVNEFVSLSK